MATLKDVAAKAGVTVTTVSRVLNDRGYISKDTRRRVYQAMQELQYQPNELARSLSKKYANTIGVIVPSVRHPFFCEVANYLEYYAGKHGFKMILCNSYHREDKEMEHLNVLRSNRVAGIVLCSRNDDIRQYMEMNIPIVTFERIVSQDISAVACDNFQGGELAAEHLTECGCRNLLYISGPKDIHLPADNRRAGFECVCRQRQIPFRVSFTQEEQILSMDYGASVERILEENQDVDGVFASSDVLAAEVIHACAGLGIKIPQDLKLVGFDDIRLASLLTPRVTTIRQPVKQMCECAISALLRQAKKDAQPSRTILSVSLIKRETT